MEKKETIVILSLGSNLGDRAKNISESLNLINQNIGQIVKVSDNIETEPVDFSSENNFLNCCCQVGTILEPSKLLDVIKKIEKDMGRVYSVSGYQDRIIDIDIIFYSDRIVQTEKLTIPHPNFRKRKFVTIPLQQLSNFQDPISFLTTEQLNR